MNENLRELFANLPAYLGGHVLLSMTALAAALAISLPLGIVASRRPNPPRSGSNRLPVGHSHRRLVIPGTRITREKT